MPTYTPSTVLTTWGLDDQNPDSPYHSSPGIGWTSDRYGATVANWARDLVYKVTWAYESDYNTVSPYTAIAGITKYNRATRTATSYLDLVSGVTSELNPNWDDLDGVFLLPNSFSETGADILALLHEYAGAPGGDADTFRLTLVNMDTGTVINSHAVSNVSKYKTTQRLTVHNVGDTNKWYMLFNSTNTSSTVGLSVIEITTDGTTSSIVEQTTASLALPLGFTGRSTHYTAKGSLGGVTMWFASDDATTIDVSVIDIPYPYSAPTITNSVVTKTRDTTTDWPFTLLQKEIAGTNYFVVTTRDNSDGTWGFIGYTYDTPTGTYTEIYDVELDLGAEYGTDIWTNPQYFSDSCPCFEGFAYHNTHEEGTNTVLLYQSADPITTPSGSDLVNRFAVLCVADGDVYTPVGIDNFFDATKTPWTGVSALGSEIFFGVTSIPGNEVIAPALYVNSTTNPNGLYSWYTTELFSYSSMGLSIICSSPAVGACFIAELDTTYYDFVARYPEG